MSRRTRGFPPTRPLARPLARRIACPISMGQYQRSLVQDRYRRHKLIGAAVSNQPKSLTGLSYLQFSYLGLLQQRIGSVWALELRLPSVCYYA